MNENVKADELMEKLVHARKKKKELELEIDGLLEAIEDAGGNPDPWKVDYTKRNNEMYYKWKSGSNFTQIAKEYHRSPQLVRRICHRIDAKKIKAKFHKNI